MLLYNIGCNPHNINGGTKTETTETTEEAHSEFEGKYVVVAECLANIWNYTVDGGFELMADGVATYSSYGADYDAAWKSYAVEDIFVDDKSGEIPADALMIEINADQSAHIIYNGEDLGVTDWFMMDDWGGVNSEEPKYTVAWNIKDDGVYFDVVKDDKMYTFHGIKQ